MQSRAGASERPPTYTIAMRDEQQRVGQGGRRYARCLVEYR